NGPVRVVVPRTTICPNLGGAFWIAVVGTDFGERNRGEPTAGILAQQEVHPVRIECRFTLVAGRRPENVLVIQWIVDPAAYVRNASTDSLAIESGNTTVGNGLCPHTLRTQPETLAEVGGKRNRRTNLLRPLLQLIQRRAIIVRHPSDVCPAH